MVRLLSPIATPPVRRPDTNALFHVDTKIFRPPICPVRAPPVIASMVGWQNFVIYADFELHLFQQPAGLRVTAVHSECLSGARAHDVGNRRRVAIGDNRPNHRWTSSPTRSVSPSRHQRRHKIWASGAVSRTIQVG